MYSIELSIANKAKQKQNRKPSNYLNLETVKWIMAHSNDKYATIKSNDFGKKLMRPVCLIV